MGRGPESEGGKWGEGEGTWGKELRVALVNS